MPNIKIIDELYMETLEKANAELVRALRDAADLLMDSIEGLTIDTADSEEYREIADKYDRHIKESE